MTEVGEIRTFPVPSDMQFTRPDGSVNPAWHRYLLRLKNLIPLINQATAIIEANTDNLGARLATLEGQNLNSRLTTVEDRFGQEAVDPADETLLTFGGTYLQSEVEALAAQVQANAIVLNLVIAALVASGLTEE